MEASYPRTEQAERLDKEKAGRLSISESSEEEDIPPSGKASGVAKGGLSTQHHPTERVKMSPGSCPLGPYTPGTEPTAGHRARSVTLSTKATGG